MKNSILSLLLLCLVFTCLKSQSNRVGDSFLAQERRANKLFNKGHYADAFQLVDSINNQALKRPELKWLLLLAKLNYEFGDYQLAQNQLDTVLKSSAILTQNQRIETLNLLAKTYVDLWKEGSDYYERADSISLEVFKLLQDTSEYSALYINTLNAYAYNKEYADAIPIYLKSLTIQKTTTNKDALTYLQTLRLLANAYFFEEQFDAFEQTIKDCNAFQQKNNLQNHIYYAKSQELLGYYFFDKENFKKAIAVFSLMDATYSKSYGKQHKNRLHNLFFLAASYFQIQDFLNTEKNYLEILGIEKFHGTDRVEYAQVLCNLADLYQITGRSQKAIDYSRKAIKIFEKTDYYKNDNGFYGLAYLNCGNAFFALKDYRNAEKHFSIADSIFTKREQWSHLIATKRTQGAIYKAKGDLATSLTYYETGLKLVREKGGTKTNLISLYYAIADNCYYQGTSKKALHYSVKAKKLCREVYGEKSILYTRILGQLGRIFEAESAYSMAKHHFKLSNNNLSQQLREYYPALGEEERIQFLESTKKLADAFYIFAAKNSAKIPDLAAKAQNLSLSIKGLGLETSRNMLALQQNARSKPIYIEWLETRKKLRATFNRSSSQLKEKKIDPQKIQEQLLLLEKQMGWETKKKAACTSKELQQKIKEREAVIDFIHFNTGNLTLGEANTIQYCAIINKARLDYPIIVPLCKESELKPFLARSIKANANNYVTTPAINKELFQLIWQPLVKHLEDVNSISLSPTGILHHLAFGTLYDEEIPLAQKFEFVYYATLRDFVNRKADEKLQGDIVLIGGSDYDYNLENINKDGREEKKQREALEKNLLPALRGMSDSTRNAISFDYLPGTAAEVKNIANNFEQKKRKVHLFTGENAVEEVVKSFTAEKAPEILHIATHGFFFKPLSITGIDAKIPRESIQMAKNPLFRSGLVFTGVNKAWKEGQIIEGREDGILTAFEIYNLDLSKTQLVVLSACDTGKGDVFNGEGVFGLQRAFLLARANKLLISLWKIPDNATALLMEVFYDFILEGHAVKQAFSMAQRQLIKEHPDWSAFYWGAFILLD